ncbi:MAG: glycosyltransferase family 4 protein [Thermoleophilaceae bacterium]|nr:glycosyltransferase family 4 protein [Thermoleophilaceae bacterium]
MTGERVRVLVCWHQAGIGGAGIAMLRVLPLLESEGFGFVHWAPPGPLREQLVGRGDPVRGLPRPVEGYSVAGLRAEPGPLARIRAVPPYAASYLRALRELRPQLVHANSLYSMAEALLARSVRLPSLLFLHEVMRPTWKSRAAGSLTRIAGLDVAAVSRAGANAFGAGPIDLIAPGVGDMPAARGERAGERTRLRIGTIGAISHMKGTDLFVDAARRLLARGGAHDFRIVGATSYALEVDWARDVLSGAESAGIDWRESVDVRAELPEWDLFVLPSRRDAFPLVVLEAMAAGVPVVATRAGGIAEQLEGGGGVLVPSEDPVALADAIEALAQDPARRAALGEEGRSSVAKRFTLSRQAAGLARAYRASIGS